MRNVKIFFLFAVSLVFVQQVFDLFSLIEFIDYPRFILLGYLAFLGWLVFVQQALKEIRDV